MFKFSYNGNDFWIEEYKIYDSETNKQVTFEQAKELASYYVKSLNFNNMSKELVKEGIEFAYMYEDFEDVPKLIRVYFEREDVEEGEKKLIIPRLAECYRRTDPNKAINLYHYIREVYGDYLISTEFIMEVANALCDLKKYEEAKEMCEWAYNLRKPNIEAILEVYKRIQKETGEI